MQSIQASEIEIDDDAPQSNVRLTAPRVLNICVCSAGNRTCTPNCSRGAYFTNTPS